MLERRRLTIRHQGKSATIAAQAFAGTETEGELRLYLEYLRTWNPDHEVYIEQGGQLIRVKMRDLDLCVPKQAEFCHPGRESVTEPLTPWTPTSLLASAA